MYHSFILSFHACMYSNPFLVLFNENSLKSRERFSSGAEQSTIAQNDAASPRSPHTEVTKNSSQMNNSSTPNKPDEHTQNHEVNFIEQENPTPVQDSSAHIIEDLPEEPGPNPNLTWQETSTENRNLDSQETADENTCFDGWDGNDVAEEVEENYLQYAETSYDWITDISRPRSYWEDRRQEWYQEMLSSNSENVEIRQLLERYTFPFSLLCFLVSPSNLKPQQSTS